MSRKTYRQIIVTPELLEKVNLENKRLVSLFLKEKSSHASKTTINKYGSDGDIFFCWNALYNDNKVFTDIRKLDLANFFAFASDELRWGSSRNNSMRSFLSSLSSFIERFMDDQYPAFKNIILRTILSVPKELRREKTILSEKQVVDLLEHLSQTNSQQACWVALAAYSGCRFSELLRFTIDLIEEDHTAFGDLFLETKRQIVTKGRGRDGKLLYKYILREKFLPFYRAWLKDREEIMNKNNKTHLALFIQKNGDPATDGTIRSWLTTMENYLGTNLYPHCLRHFLVTEFSKKNIPPMLIRDLVGWSDLSMIPVYDDSTSKDKTWVELDNLK